jgi:hypothetical protein
MRGGGFQERAIMKIKSISFVLLVAAVAVAPLSEAAARGRWFHHKHGVVLGLFDAGATVVAGVATIVTAPIAILADAASRPGYEGRRADDADDDSYAQRRAYRQEAREAYADRRGDYGAPPDYRYAPRGSYGPPAGYNPPPQAYYGPPQDYARQGYAARGYAPQGYPPQGYAPPRDDRDPSSDEDGPAPDGE